MLPGQRTGLGQNKSYTLSPLRSVRSSFCMKTMEPFSCHEIQNCLVQKYDICEVW